MDRFRKERSVTSSDSPPEGPVHELQDLPTSKRQEEGKSGRSGTKTEGKGKRVVRSDSDNNFRKKSRIQELLNTFKDDVVHVRETEVINDEASLGRFPIPGAGQSDFPAKFTRVSPQKLSVNSRWKKAVKLSRNVMNRPKQTLSIVSRGLKGGEGEEEYEEEANDTKMILLLKFFDHASCISSGLLTGLLLWSTLNAVSWQSGTTKTAYVSDRFLRIYYTTSVVLLYITLIGFLIRIYTSWTRWSGAVVVYIGAFLMVLVLHYISKGYNLLRLECSIFSSLSESHQKKVLKAYTCASLEEEEKVFQQDLIFMVITNAIQTLGALLIACYFHFIPYKQLWLVPASKISSRRIMSP